MSDRLGIGITMNITDKDGRSIVNIDKEKTWLDKLLNNNPNENWWITGWNPKVQGLTNRDLTLTGVLDFSDNEKSRQMYESLKGTEQDDNLKSKIKDLGNYRIEITW